MALYLGVDGGGTGCRAVIADAAGRVLGHGQAGPANIASDMTSAHQSILQATEAALIQAFGHARDIAGLQAGLGLAGANAADRATELALSLPFARSRIETDAVTAARGALGAADGIVAALGTGSVFAVQTDGVVRSFGGWGLTLGDEGSGAHIGRQALAMALRAVDGTVSDTALLQDLRRRHGDAAAIVRFAVTATAGDFAALAPGITASDDPAARTIMAHAEGDVRAMLTHLRALTPLPVTFIGGLGAIYAARLADIPQRAALGTALDGALHLARGA